MELLAPAGSFETLTSAVQSGADAVYIGGSEFSARRSAVNFTLEEIKKAADYCHMHYVKLHVAANILVKEKEKAAFLNYIGALCEAGVDAVIIQDIGMAKLVHEMYPDLCLHASTQMTAASVEAAEFLQNMGFSRIVISRELSIAAIKEICDKTDVEIEVFAHGALCMSYSGQCLMSSIIGGRSGNRGMCAQPCRLPYELDDKKGYLLSPKDLCMLSHIAELKKIGVTSLKIEGRLKRKEYAAAVCGVYRKYIDNPAPVQAKDMQELADAFNRSGFTDGYGTGKIGSEMMSYKNPANAAENKFSDDVKKRCRPDANYRKNEIFISASLRLDEPLKISVWDSEGNFASAEGELRSELAQNRPLDGERVVEQLKKLGSTPFYAETVELELQEGVTIPISEINNVRRNAVESFSTELCRIKEYRVLPVKKIEEKPHRNGVIITAEVNDYAQAMSCINGGVTEIYAPTRLANQLEAEGVNAHIIAKLPPIYRSDRSYEKPLTDSILVSNVGQIDKNKKCYGDFRLNITNSESMRFFDNLERITLSPELNLKELAQLSEGGEIIAYGRLPLMVMENCPAKALGKCQKFKNKYTLTDRMGEKFPLRCSEGCTVELLNSKPIYMADKLDFVNKLKINAIRLVFTVENSAECDKIIKEYKMALAGKNVNAPTENSFTRGHFYRGVE